MALQVLYDTNSGLVLQWQNTAQYNYNPPASTQAVLPVTQEQWDNQNTQSQWYIISGVLSGPTQEMLLQQAQNKQLGIIKTAFNNANNSPYNSTVVGKEVDYNQQSMLNVDGLIKYMQANTSVTNTQFRCADNSFVTLTLTQLQSLQQEMISYGLSLYQKKWTLENEINSATTPTAVASITW